MSGEDGGFENVLSFTFVLFLRKFHDQYRGLTGYPEEKNETNLRIDVVVDPCKPKCAESAKKSYRNRQNHSERDHPAFVLCHQEEIDEGQRECEDHDYLVTR